MTDASRLRVVGGAAVLAGAVAIGAFYGTRDRAVTPVAAPTPPAAPRASAERPPGQVPDRGAAAPAEQATSSPSAPAPSQSPSQSLPQAPGRAETRPARAAEPARPEAPRSDPPRFDVVRMGARGMVVVAGRAAPGAEVVLFEGGREIGRARADSRGEWVILPADPLGAGARELSLRARLQGGEEVAGPDTVLVVGPAPAEPQLAQAPARQDTRPAATRADQAPSAAATAAGDASREAAPRLAEGAPRAGEAQAAEDRAGPNRVAENRVAETTVAGTPAEGGRPAEAARPEQSLVLLLPPTAAAAPRVLSAPPGAEAPAAPLGLDVVDYDDSNTMRFAGTAPPGAQLRIYSDDRHLGDAQADRAGRWSLTPQETPPVGRHMLRVDQLGSTGAPPAVASRVEVAFQRESLPPGAVRDGQVVVQPGNNLWRIARDAYGRGIRYTVIYRANQAQIRNPARIYPGQVFAVPEVR